MNRWKNKSSGSGTSMKGSVLPYNNNTISSWFLARRFSLTSYLILFLLFAGIAIKVIHKFSVYLLLKK